MANDCEYRVKITGSEENLTKLNKALNCEPIKNDNLLSNDTYGILFEDISDVEDWGAKWTVFNTIEYDDDYPDNLLISIRGYSAWGPTTGLWEKISKEYNVDVVCEYSERGMDFAGIINWTGGEEVSHDEMTYWEYNYNHDYDYFWDEIQDQSEWDNLDGMKETLGKLYNNLNESEVKRIEELFGAKSE